MSHAIVVDDAQNEYDEAELRYVLLEFGFGRDELAKVLDQIACGQGAYLVSDDDQAHVRLLAALKAIGLSLYETRTSAQGRIRSACESCAASASGRFRALPG
jgi:hypothetical protein